MQVVLNSEVWTIIEDNIIDLDEDEDGNTDFDTRTILIHPDLHPECRLKVLIHEMLHASCEWMAESAVADVTEDIARVLFTKFLYRSELEG